MQENVDEEHFNEKKNVDVDGEVGWWRAFQWEEGEDVNGSEWGMKCM